MQPQKTEARHKFLKQACYDEDEKEEPGDFSGHHTGIVTGEDAVDQTRDQKKDRIKYMMRQKAADDRILSGKRGLLQRGCHTEQK